MLRCRYIKVMIKHNTRRAFRHNIQIIRIEDVTAVTSNITCNIFFVVSGRVVNVNLFNRKLIVTLKKFHSWENPA